MEGAGLDVDGGGDVVAAVDVTEDVIDKIGFLPVVSAASMVPKLHIRMVTAPKHIVALHFTYMVMSVADG